MYAVAFTPIYTLMPLAIFRRIRRHIVDADFRRVTAI